MVDLHCHILPGLDDGPQSIEESLRMAESAIADGITHVVATPHANSTFPFDYGRVRERRDELHALVGDQLTLATGCDFHLNPENLASLKQNAPHFCINQKDYLLVEFNEISIPPAMDQTLHKFHLAGLRPVITHPERNALLRAQPERLAKWVRQGCYAQVTGGSLTGVFGPGAREDAFSWIGNGLIHFVSSDAHNTKGRPLKLRPAYDVICKKWGEGKARALLVVNPLAAFEGRALPHIPEVPDDISQRRRKRFFFF